MNAHISTLKKEYEIPLTKADLCAMFRVSIGTIDRHMISGKLKFSKVGHQVRFFDSHIQDYLNTCQEDGRVAQTQMAANSNESCGN